MLLLWESDFDSGSGRTCPTLALHFLILTSRLCGLYSTILAFHPFTIFPPYFILPFSRSNFLPFIHSTVLPTGYPNGKGWKPKASGTPFTHHHQKVSISYSKMSQLEELQEQVQILLSRQKEADDKIKKKLQTFCCRKRKDFYPMTGAILWLDKPHSDHIRRLGFPNRPAPHRDQSQKANRQSIKNWNVLSVYRSWFPPGNRFTHFLLKNLLKNRRTPDGYKRQ